MDNISGIKKELRKEFKQVDSEIEIMEKAKKQASQALKNLSGSRTLKKNVAKVHKNGLTSELKTLNKTLAFLYKRKSQLVKALRNLEDRSLKDRIIDILKRHKDGLETPEIRDILVKDNGVLLSLDLSAYLSTYAGRGFIHNSGRCGSNKRNIVWKYQQ